MNIRLLTESEFGATFAMPMQNVTGSATSVVDIWRYVASIPQEDLQSHTIYDNFVEYVYRDAKNRYDQVLVMTKTKNVYLVIVVDIQQSCIYGHHLLDLNKKYGLSKE